VWLALALSKHVHHAGVSDWLETIAEPASVLFCRATQQTFLRLLTNTAVLAPYGNPPLTNQQAWTANEALLADDRIVFRADEPAGLDLRWKEFALRDTASPKLWMDAYLLPLLSPADIRRSRPTSPSASSAGWISCCSAVPDG
jgi:toxin-antitoxin system PIN domain toxin